MIRYCSYFNKISCHLFPCIFWCLEIFFGREMGKFWKVRKLNPLLYSEHEGKKNPKLVFQYIFFSIDFIDKYTFWFLGWTGFKFEDIFHKKRVLNFIFQEIKKNISKYLSKEHYFIHMTTLSCLILKYCSKFRL